MNKIILALFVMLGAALAEPPSSYLPPPKSGPAGPAPKYGVPGRMGGGGHDDHSTPAKYNFKYDVQAPEFMVDFGHQEQRDGDNTQGSYYVLLPDGRKQKVEYTVDEWGYKPKITYTGGNNGGNNGGGYKSNGGY